MIAGMKRIKYAIYPPAELGLPWLAVWIVLDKPVDGIVRGILPGANRPPLAPPDDDAGKPVPLLQDLA